MYASQSPPSRKGFMATLSFARVVPEEPAQLADVERQVVQLGPVAVRPVHSLRGIPVQLEQLAPARAPQDRNLPPGLRDVRSEPRRHPEAPRVEFERPVQVPNQDSRVPK